MKGLQVLDFQDSVGSDCYIIGPLSDLIDYWNANYFSGNHFGESQSYWDDGTFVDSTRWPQGSSVIELHMDDVLLDWKHLCNAARP